MYNGKFSGRKRRLLRKRQFVLIVSIALLLVGMVGGTLAYLLDSTGDVQNVFTPASVPPVIDEPDWEDGDLVKKNVTITNNGDIAAYIRAAVVINWIDDDGNIVANPEDHSHSDFESDDGWFDGGDGYYYYSSIVPAKENTSKLIGEIKPTEGTEYRLQVDVMAQSIQSVPTSVVEQKWGVTVADDGTISK